MKLCIRAVVVLTLLVFVGRASAQAIKNPVIPGFHPDPSIVRVGEDYYAVCSSFHYFPGVPIFHSRDLVSWEQLGNVLDRESQLPLQGASSWLGIYAPTIRYHEGTYYMITTNVGNGGNFMVTATNPQGPWSEPMWLEQQGIDPSLYFEDGKVYMVSNPDDTIFLCEIDPATGKTTAPSRPLWRGTGGRYPEGPHMYKKDRWYYLLISEGGTELAHGLTIARARNIYGPYESCPRNPIMTNCNRAGASMQIQGTGHGDLVETPDGQWWLVFLAYRNMGGSYHHLGRETCLAPVTWDADGWPVVNGGLPIDTLMAVSEHKVPDQAIPFTGDVSTDFTKLKTLTQLPPDYVWQHNPVMSRYGLSKKGLTITAGKPLAENDTPSFLGVRQCSDRATIETCLDLQSLRKQNGNVNAGLSVFQIHEGYFTLTTDGNNVTATARIKTINTPCNHPGVNAELPQTASTLTLRMVNDAQDYIFLYSVDGSEFREVARQSQTLISTEVVGGFTGVTAGMYAEGDGKATFQRFSIAQ